MVEGRQISFEGGFIGKVRLLAEELELAGFVGRGDLFPHQPAMQWREHRHGQQEAAPAFHPALNVS